MDRTVLINNPPAALFTPREKTERNNSMKINTSRKAGFTLVEIMIVVAIIGLLAAIAIPNFVRARKTSQTNACINNLRQIDSAKQQWALEANQTGNAEPAESAIAPYIGRDVSATTLAAAGCNCPVGGTYDINALDATPSCGDYSATDHPAVLGTPAAPAPAVP